MASIHGFSLPDGFEAGASFMLSKQPWQDRSWDLNNARVVINAGQERIQVALRQISAAVSMDIESRQRSGIARSVSDLSIRCTPMQKLPEPSGAGANKKKGTNGMSARFEKVKEQFSEAEERAERDYSLKLVAQVDAGLAHRYRDLDYELLTQESLKASIFGCRPLPMCGWHRGSSVIRQVLQPFWLTACFRQAKTWSVSN